MQAVVQMLHLAKHYNMRVIVFIVFGLTMGSALAQPFTLEEISRWDSIAAGITIHRDNWDVPHIYGKTDADAAFGLLYAQCEDDFYRLERNYISVLGRLAEVEGEDLVWEDLRQRLFTDSVTAIRLYSESPDWLKRLMQAFADGCNYYLYTHPEVQPRLIRRFQPWMPLMFSEGSIGGDITAISLANLKSFYTGRENTEGEIRPAVPVQGGSNGIAIAPSRTADKKALLLINPHTSYYFRTEAHVVSEEGLNAYGAVTWGQFFVYQGFNEYCGWMHTSSTVDVIDLYSEEIEKQGDRIYYKYDGKKLAVKEKEIVIKYKGKESERLNSWKFNAYFTHHGPVVASTNDGKWVTAKIIDEPVKALMQSFGRTKAKNYDDFVSVLKLYTNSSNNTVYADREGNIAYWQGNFLPKRNTAYNWRGIVDGSTSATEWGDLHPLEELVHFRNPLVGWLQNCNSTPYYATGELSPDPSGYPAYMGPNHQNFRAVNAIRVLRTEDKFTLDKLEEAAYNTYLPFFEKLIPALIEADIEAPSKYREAVDLLKAWDLNISENSVAGTLAIYWAGKLLNEEPRKDGLDEVGYITYLATQTESKVLTAAFDKAVKQLQAEFNTWKMPWGEVNRFQRITGEVNEKFSDGKPSKPLRFPSGLYGALATADAVRPEGQKKQYAVGGNSFVAVVEFGERVRAKTIVTGGHSSNPDSEHFLDQDTMFRSGVLKPVWIYPEDVLNHSVRKYRPGKKN